jgi:hypothetical protein
VSFVHRSGLGPRVFAALAAAVLLLALIAGSVAASDSHGALRDSYVAPRHGTPATVIRFSVTFQGQGERSHAHVDVLVDGVAHAMVRSGMPLLVGVRFSLSTTLGLGTHGIAFRGADGRSSDTLPAGSVTIAADPGADPSDSGGGGGTNPGGQPGPTATPPVATPTPTPPPAATLTPGPAAPTPKPNPRPTMAPAAPTAPAAPGVKPTPGDGGTSDGVGPPPGSSTGGAQATSLDVPGAADHTSGPGGGPATGGSPAGAPPTAGREYDSAGAIVSSPTPSPEGLALGLTGMPEAGGGGAGGSGGSGPTGGSLDDRTLDLLTGTVGDIPPATRMLVAAISTTTATTAAAAFFLFGKRRRDGEPPEPDEVLAANAARLSDRPSSSLVPVDAPGSGARDADENAIPRWRRPSLIEARKSDPRYSATAPHGRQSFNHGGDPDTAGTERRRIRYRAVSLLDAPDPLRSAAIGDLDEGDEVQLLERSGGYWLVLCPDGMQGWVHRMTLGDVVEYEGGSSAFNMARRSFATRVADAAGTARGGEAVDPSATGAALPVDRSIAEDGTDLLSAYIARRHATFGKG